MEFFIISMLNGVSYGLLLFMLSSGLTLIFSMMGVLNFAHASFYMVGRLRRLQHFKGWWASGPRWCSRRWSWWASWVRDVRALVPAQGAQVSAMCRSCWSRSACRM
jgi:branched-subunit amino acid ABC-type transport system permease component